MNIYGRKIIIDRKMGKILCESEIVKNNEYNWLLKQLLYKGNTKKNEKYELNIQNIQNLDYSQKSFLDSSAYDELYKTACNEWFIYNIVDNEQELECALCGEKKNKKKYYIKNRKNGEILNIGSTCIENFRDIRDKNGKTIKQLDKEFLTRAREEKLNNLYPGIIKRIDCFYKRLDDLPTIINENLEKKYNEKYSKIKTIYEKYKKNKKLDTKLAYEINDLLNKGDEIFELIHKDIDEKRKDEWYISKEIKDWCYKNYDDNVNTINFLKRDGVIKLRSAWRITESNLVNKVVEKFNRIFIQYNTKIVKYNNQNRKVIFNIETRNKYTKQINLEYSYKDLLINYGEEIFEKKLVINETSIEQIIIDSNINDVTSLNRALECIKNLTNNVEIKKCDFDYNELIIKLCRDNENYYKINAKRCINYFKENIYNNKFIENDKITTYLNKNSEIISTIDYDKKGISNESIEHLIRKGDVQ